MPHDYGFRPLSRADTPMLAHWLAQPHIGGWWGPPEQELALIERDRSTGISDMRIVTCDGVPFAYVQDYPAQSDNTPHYAHFPKDAGALDTFIGAPEFLGKGHAPAYLRLWATQLAKKYSTVLVDPDKGNTRAIATYQSAGFAHLNTPSTTGTAVQVMRFTL